METRVHPRFLADSAPRVETIDDLPAVYRRGWQLFARSLYDNNLDAGVVYTQRTSDEESAPLGLCIADVSRLEGRKSLDQMVRTLDEWAVDGYPEDALQIMRGRLNG